MVLWIFILYGLVGVYRDEDAYSSVLRNVGAFVSNYTLSHPGRWQSSYSPPWRSQIWLCYDLRRSIYFVCETLCILSCVAKEHIFNAHMMATKKKFCFVNRLFKRYSHTSAYTGYRNIYCCPDALCSGQYVDEWMCGWGCTYGSVSTVLPWIMQTFTCIRSHTTTPR